MPTSLNWTCLPDGRCDYLGESWVKYTGVPEKEHLGYGWLDAVHPEDRESAHRSWREISRDGVTGSFDFRIRSADGAYATFRTHVVPHSEEGVVVKWFGVNQLIAEGIAEGIAEVGLGRNFHSVVVPAELRLNLQSSTEEEARELAVAIAGGRAWQKILLDMGWVPPLIGLEAALRVL